MADNNDPVVPQPGQPVADPAPATDPKEDKGTPVNPPEADPNVSELIRQRDRNFNKAQTAEEKLADVESRLDFIEAEKEKNSYIEVLAKKNDFNAEERAILAEAASPDQADKLAETLVKYKENAEQKALEELQKVGTDAPRLDADTVKSQLKELEGSGDIEKMLELKRQL